MRRILVENARKKRSLRRDNCAERQALDQVEVTFCQRNEQLLALDQALERLEEIDKKKADLVKLRYFAGLTAPQAAEVLGVSVTTANRYWAYARAWLLEELHADEATTVD